ncbi:MAG: hypothetical protein Q3998_04215, partial [Porphyromonas sp.]|nr:hypothetical protein [Porphyromonas sp.]
SSQIKRCSVCKTDNSVTLLLSSSEVRPFLTAREIVEQEIGSVSYAVALCQSCNNKEICGIVLTSSYIKCPNCGGLTMKKQNVSVTPNYIYTTYSCLYCKHTKTNKSPRFSSTSSAALGAAVGAMGGFRGGGGSFGGGFGGGRSGGGGATTRF